MPVATSGTYNFSPDIAEMTAEAWERLGFEPETLKARHARSTRRSLAFMFAHWLTKGFKQPWMTTQSITLTQGQINVNPAAPAVDVFHVYLTRAGLDVEMYPISNSEYEAIPNKSQQGRPTMYFVDYETLINNAQPVVKIWQASQNNTDIINLRCLNRTQDVTQGAQGLFLPYLWYEAVVSDLAARLAVKWRPDRLSILAPLAADAVKSAFESTREKASTHFRARFRM